MSPVWDTGLAALALLEDGAEKNREELARAFEWLRPLQLLDEPGDWQVNHPGLPGGGWAFQYENAFYPDLDDTAVVAWAMNRGGRPGTARRGHHPGGRLAARDAVVQRRIRRF